MGYDPHRAEICNVWSGRVHVAS